MKGLECNGPYDTACQLGESARSCAPKIKIIQTDKAREFAKLFEEACSKLKIPHYFSRVKTPKDNAINERFNRTLKEEFIQLGNFTPDPLLFNQRLTEWLIEYDFNRAHQSLGYLSPIE